MISVFLLGVLGARVMRKMKKDLTNKNMENPNRKCQAGIEVHFRNQQNCVNIQKGGRVKRRPWSCMFCIYCACIVEI